jgi:hypothetical protein
VAFAKPVHIRAPSQKIHEPGRGYAFALQFPNFITNWVDFVNQNKSAETEIDRLNSRRCYEPGHADRV